MKRAGNVLDHFRLRVGGFLASPFFLAAAQRRVRGHHQNLNPLTSIRKSNNDQVNTGSKTPGTLGAA